MCNFYRHTNNVNQSLSCPISPSTCDCFNNSLLHELQLELPLFALCDIRSRHFLFIAARFLFMVMLPMQRQQHRSEVSQAALRAADIRDNDLIPASYFSALKLPHHVCRKLLVYEPLKFLVWRSLSGPRFETLFNIIVWKL